MIIASLLPETPLESPPSILVGDLMVVSHLNMFSMFKHDLIFQTKTKLIPIYVLRLGMDII